MIRKAVILAGGLGSRLMEETQSRPKPMVEIGGFPIIWHIMKIFSASGINEFVIPLGYKGYMIKEYFANYYRHVTDMTLNIRENSVDVLSDGAEPWKITLVETGLSTMTGGRLKQLRKYLGDESFCMTYGDGVAAIDMRRVIAFHKAHGRLATITAVRPPSRFGSLQIDGAEGGAVNAFLEKPPEAENWINGGFFVLSPSVLDLIEGDQTIWEKEPLETLTRQGQLMALKHRDFWHSMDTLRDKLALEALWESGAAPWKVW